MERAMVSVATGVLSPLLGKLSSLLAKEYSKLEGVRDEILFLKEELSSMHAFLEKLADVDDLDIQIKEWRSQVLELSYDIEDCIDDFMLRVDHGSDKKGFFQKSIHKLKTLGARHDIAEQILKLKARVGGVSERRIRYNFDETISNSGGVVPIDPRLTALYTDVKRLVGMDGPKDEIIKLLTEGEGELVQKLRVVSIWGFGGLGKTTLANLVYHQHKDQFECKAFVSVSQKPDLIRLLTKILSEITGQQCIPTYEAKDLIDKLKNHLLDKRYFAIIDDIWDESIWSVIRCAFPENNLGSRVITTTRIESLARACCDYRLEYVYKMRPLNDQDSRRLFFGRIFGSEDACPPHHKEVSAEILEKCDGLPLAIITIASILATQAIEQKMQWEHVQYSLRTVVGANLSWEGMRQILNLSYINLPHCLRTCFLYLGIYPEDYLIKKNDLISRWIAEGFVREVQGRDVEDVAESYFNELVNRSMIEIEHTYYDKVQICRVHDLMLDLIMHKSRDENFITIIGDPQDITGPRYKARRLSLHFGYAKHGTIPATFTVSQVRSLMIFRRSDFIHKLSLSKFKLIRVLIIQFMGPLRNTPIDLTGISALFQLRFFKVDLVPSSHLQLPSRIQGLQYLETFVINPAIRYPQSDIVIPSDIVYLPRLLHLVIPFKTKLLNGIDNMKSLSTLECLVESPQHLQGLAELNNLRYLRIHFDGVKSCVDMTEFMDALCSSLGKIAGRNLKYLFLDSFVGADIYLDGLSNLSSSPRHLRMLDLWGWYFSRFPKWIGELHYLNTLELMVGQLLTDDVHVLAQLPALVYLKLFLLRAPKERTVIFGTGFPVLKNFTFACRRMCLVFEAGVMPKLQWLRLVFCNRHGEEHVPHLLGTDYLSSLKEINAGICGFWDGESMIRTESALMNAIHMHPAPPTVTVTLGPWRWHDEEEDG